MRNHLHKTITGIAIILSVGATVSTSTEHQTVSLKSSGWSVTITNIVAATWDEGESVGYYMHPGDGRAADATPKEGVLSKIAPKAGEKIVLISAEIVNTLKDPAKVQWQDISLRLESRSTNVLQVCKFPSDDMFWGPSRVAYTVVFPPGKAISVRLFFIVPREAKEMTFFFPTLSSMPLSVQEQKKSEK